MLCLLLILFCVLAGAEHADLNGIVDTFVTLFSLQTGDSTIC
jgi:hypothetical protein